MATKTTTKLSDLENAQKILNQIEAKAAELSASRASDERELASLSFAAHGDADQKAFARLETIKARMVKRDLDMKSIEAALAEAQRRLAAAQEAEAAAEQRQNAAQARIVVERIDELFASADIHFKQAMDALEAAESRIEEVHRLGFAYPTAVQLRANSIFALETCMTRLPKYMWDELSRGGLRYPSPSQRRTFSQFWAAMSATLGREIASRLGEKHNKEDAA